MNVNCYETKVGIGEYDESCGCLVSSRFKEPPCIVVSGELERGARDADAVGIRDEGSAGAER